MPAYLVIVRFDTSILDSDQHTVDVQPRSRAIDIEKRWYTLPALPYGGAAPLLNICISPSSESCFMAISSHDGIHSTAYLANPQLLREPHVYPAVFERLRGPHAADAYQSSHSFVNIQLASLGSTYRL